MTLERPILLYDGDCGFCTTSATWIESRLGSSATVRPWRPDDATRLGVSNEAADREIHFVTPKGSVLGGADAVLAWWRSGAAVWRILGQVLRAPMLIQLTRLGYRLVARNRHRLPGSTAACAIPAR
ncbi:MAG TPA: DUF393 domain-containing protein [Candidatus Avipropionibacterium avicola]|uniref:DUF393 domain-containing protein n=1 Tax=Candidatus Avipropionibacterium avicola TaxID=2840701 RepID=A0A9D1KKZ0_9ACTN|nr:DUF393 domain-containing protein [Candidatus Avipropionibacterium avicola]